MSSLLIYEFDETSHGYKVEVKVKYKVKTNSLKYHRTMTSPVTKQSFIKFLDEQNEIFLN